MLCFREGWPAPFHQTVDRTLTLAEEDCDMARKAKSALTSAQLKALKSAAARMAGAHTQARKSLAAAGFEPENGSTGCLAPPSGHCKSFKQPATPSLRCTRPGCGHSFFRHDVF